MIAIEDFSLNLGDFNLKNIQLHINEREIFAILGKTGSGKTVLLESIAGFHTGNCGSIFLEGNNIKDLSPEKRKIGFVYQDYALFPHMSVLDNITYGLRMNKMKRAEAEKIATEMAEELEIAHLLQRNPLTLSGGEQQRTALARALVLNPRILLMDEPFSALDPKTKNQMYKLIKKIHKQFKCTILFVTHDFVEAQTMAQRIGIMIDGELRAICSSEQLFQNYQDQDICDFLL
jgi:ABC-type sugar transport system ATPase subunit